LSATDEQRFALLLMCPTLERTHRATPDSAFASVYPVEYTDHMVEVRQTDEFAAWLQDLRDREARGRILARIRRISLGNLGDIKSVGDGLSELRVDSGPGYRIYLTQRGQELVILLAGGDKRTQQRDIDRAKRLARDL
jgi:putative addiction module killer protein